MQEEKVAIICKKHSINSLYLFGSLADGSYDEDSDLDLAYLTVNADNAPDYGSLYFDLQGISSRKLDLIDLRKASLVFTYQIIKDGKVIYDVDQERRTDFEDELIKKYLDYSTFTRLIQDELDANFVVEVEP